MKRLIATFAITICITATAIAQVSKKTNTATTTTGTNAPVAKQAAPEGHYCDYCKQNYAESHFPCIMKAIKGKANARTGAVEFVAGQPIGGIIVKGGRNPGGNLNMVTNQNGEIEINNAIAGDYKFTITLPTNDPNKRQSGGPIGGIIVKGGKNPGGGNFVLISNANGEIELKNLPAGNYKFTVSGATQKEMSNPLYKSSQNAASQPIKEN